MRVRNAAAAALLGLGSLLAAPAAAMEHVDYTNAAWESATAAGAPIIIGVWADWCGICQTQIGVLDALADDPRFADVVIIEVNYDTQRHIMLRFNVSFRSTIIALHGTQELRRLNAVTDPAAIEALLVELVGPAM
ncbi:MAG: thioredoxin domain-containing protein [Bauldia sp.]|jgi:thiol-disulfide isomerase/thioredoxin